MLNEDKTKERLERHEVTQEDFTPSCVVVMLLFSMSEDTFTDFSKNVFDSSCGTGNILVAVLEKRLEHCNTWDDAYLAVKSLFGVEIMADNVEICRTRLYEKVIGKFPGIGKDRMFNFKIRSIIRNRIQWGDSLKTNYREWKHYDITPRDKHENVDFKEQRKRDIDYPMYRGKIEVKALF